jgi:hypothetical protein
MWDGLQRSAITLEEELQRDVTKLKSKSRYVNERIFFFFFFFFLINKQQTSLKA